MLPSHNDKTENSGYQDSSREENASPLARSLEDALTEIAALLDRMLVLAQQSAGETEVDREQLQTELERLQRSIDRIADEMRMK